MGEVAVGGAEPLLCLVGMVVKELCRAWPDDANVVGAIGVLDKDVQLAASLAGVVDVAVVEGRGRNGSVNDGNPVLAQGSQVVDKLGIVESLRRERGGVGVRRCWQSSPRSHYSLFIWSISLQIASNGISWSSMVWCMSRTMLVFL